MKVSQTLGNYDFPCTFSNSYGNQMKNDAYFKYLRSWGTHRFSWSMMVHAVLEWVYAFKKCLNPKVPGFMKAPPWDLGKTNTW